MTALTIQQQLDDLQARVDFTTMSVMLIGADELRGLLGLVQAARKDSLRLDWLAARSRVEVEPDLRPDCGALLSWEPENDIAFRAAIDAAMSAAPLSDKEAAK